MSSHVKNLFLRAGISEIIWVPLESGGGTSSSDSGTDGNWFEDRRRRSRPRIHQPLIFTLCLTDDSEAKT